MLPPDVRPLLLLLLPWIRCPEPLDHLPPQRSGSTMGVDQSKAMTMQVMSSLRTSWVIQWL
jgi:hypothetical protein